MAGRVFGPVVSAPTRARQSATFIMLHGLGDTGHGWAPVASQLNLPHIKMLFPTAPTRPITCNMGMPMPGWFDIVSLDEAALREGMSGKAPEREGMPESVAYIGELIRKEVETGTPPERIVLGGFSQGGKVAIKTFLQHAPALAGCVMLSTWLEPRQMELNKEALDKPIFMGHGSADPLLPPFLAQFTYDYLQKLNCTNISFKIYPGMEHSSCPQEMRDLEEFLRKTLPDIPPTKADIEGMSVKELKQFLVSSSVSVKGLYEKHELLEAALEAIGEPKL